MEPDDDDEYQGGMACDACGASIDPDDEAQYSEHTGWYFCPECGHTNSGD